MARRREPKASYSPAYTRRIYKAYGVTPEVAAVRGYDMSAGRGHRRAAGAPAEKAALDIRRQAKGELTERERRFASKQAARLQNKSQGETRAEALKRAQAALKKATPAQRDRLIRMQQRAERNYNRAKSSYSYTEDFGEDFDDADFPDYDDLDLMRYYR